MAAARTLEQAVATALGNAIAATASPHQRRLWVDIGTSVRTLTQWDLEQNESLVVVGMDALKSNLDDAQQPQIQRFVRVHGACTAGPEESATINVHRSPTCGSLLRTRTNAPTVGRGKDACTGDVPTQMAVPAFSLHTLLKLLVPRLARRVELLKIDIQGAELSCLHSAGRALRHVDNVLLEVQDADEASGILFYEGSPSIAALDEALASQGHERQYCEWNMWMWHVRELNCLYSRASVDPGATELWATGNWQHDRGSMVSYEPRGYERFQRFGLVKNLTTSTFYGARVTPRFRLRPLWLNQTLGKRARRP